MRSVSGDRRRGSERRGNRPSAAVSHGRAGAEEPASAADARSGVAVAVANPIKRFDLRKILIDHFELLAQTFDMAVNRAIVDINVLAIGAIHQLIATLDVARTQR